MLRLINEINAWPNLLQLACKSFVLLVAVWLVTWCLRQASAAARHFVWSVALGGLLVLPLLTLALPGWRVDWLRISTPTAAPESSSQPVAEADEAPLEAAGSAPAAASLTTTPTVSLTPLLTVNSSRSWRNWLAALDWSRLALVLWCLGAFGVLARVAVGTACVWWLTRSAQPVTESSWLTLAGQVAARLDLRGRVALLKSQQVEMPMTWGAWRSVVLLPTEAESWPTECRNIVLLHELAHVKRRDCLTQLLAQVACAMYWFNPLVWLAARRLRIERELACDDYVLAVGTKASDYAAHLVEIAGSFTAGGQLAPVTVGMACSQLESRVRAILDPGSKRRRLSALSTLALSLLAIGLLVPLAMVQPWTNARAATNLFSHSNPALMDAAPDLSLKFAGQVNELSQATPLPPIVVPNPLPQSEPKSVVVLATETSPLPGSSRNAVRDDEEQSQGQTQSANPPSAGQNKDLTVEQLIQMRLHDITPEFIESIRRAGFENLPVRQLVELRVHGIDEAYLKDVRNWGFDKTTLREIVSLRVAGVTPAYLAAMKQMGFDKLTPNKVAAMRMHGVTPEFVVSLRQMGFDNLSADKLTAFKIHGIDEAYIKQMQALSSEKLTADDLLQFKISGVTPAYGQSLKALGFDNVPFRKLSELRLHGVTEEYIREMRGLGFDNLTVNQLLQMRIHGVTADYVKKLRAAGFKNVSVNQMLEMRIHGVDDILLKGSR